MANGKKTYSEKLKDPRWQKKRLEIMERDSFKCVHCSDEETTLNVHHKKYTGEPWEAPNKDLETVCEDCHSVIDDIQGVKDARELNLIHVIKHKYVYGFSLYMICEDIIGVISYHDGESNTITMNQKLLEDILKTMKNG